MLQFNALPAGKRTKSKSVLFILQYLDSSRLVILTMLNNLAYSQQLLLLKQQVWLIHCTPSQFPQILIRQFFSIPPQPYTLSSRAAPSSGVVSVALWLGSCSTARLPPSPRALVPAELPPATAAAAAATAEGKGLILGLVGGRARVSRQGNNCRVAGVEGVRRATLTGIRSGRMGEIVAKEHGRRWVKQKKAARRPELPLQS